jgi:formamidopyrimidine-DNA glycosylase
MPELPDVEGFRQVLAGHAVGRRIERVDVHDPGVLHGVTASQLDSNLRGRQFAEPVRHGKWLIAPTGGASVLMHFGMTGNLRWTDRDAPDERFDRVSFVTGAGELRYGDMRKLQGITLAKDVSEVNRLLGPLGPDALSVKPGEFARLLEDRRAAIKAVLIDQHVIAGLGNLLVDEILWRARIYPRRPARSLTAQELRTLHTQMRRVLRASVSAGRIPARPSWLTGVRDQSTPHCPRCGTALRRLRIGGRTTIWCPHCQPAASALSAPARPARLARDDCHADPARGDGKPEADETEDQRR